MRPIQPPCKLEAGDVTLAVSEHEVKGTRIFRIQFPDSRKALTIVVSEDRSGNRFWTSVPEGRQHEAEQFGKMIANYIRSNRQR